LKKYRNLALATSILLPTTIWAQGTTATLGGVITDTTGAVIPNATIELKNEKSEDRRVSQSNGAGSFSFSAVPVGDYDLTITAKGFGTKKETAIHLDPGDQKTVRDLALAAGASDVVTVESQAGQITLDSGEQSALISAEDIKHLSVEGRDVTELFKILPGFAIRSGVDNQAYDPSQVSVNGALGSYAANGTPINGVSLLSDGADITDPGNFGAAIQNINYEQVAEVKVQTSSFTADTPRGPVVVNAVGKSGGSSFHGSLYTFARTSQLNSTDWLANHTGQQKPPDRQVYPGFTFSGPVLIPGTSFNHAKKLTFFVGAEQYAQRNSYAYGSASSATLQALVPTAAMRTGDFSATQLAAYLGPNFTQVSHAATATSPATVGPDCSGGYSNICYLPQAGPQGQTLINGNIAPYLDPGALAEINSLPLPNTTSNGQYNYITTNLIDNNLWQARGRVDYAINNNNKLFVVYSTERGKNGVPQAEYYSPRGNLGGVNVPGGGILSTINSELGSLNLATTFSSTLTNELSISGSWLLQNFVPKSLTATQNGYPYGGLFNNGSHVLPALEDYGNDGLPLSLLPDGSFGGVYAKKWVRTASDNVTKVIGAHTLRAGVFFQLDTNHEVLPFVQTNGTVSLYYFGESFTDPVAGTVHSTGAVGAGSGGNYLANFLEGQVQSYSQANVQPSPNLYFMNLDGYIQDHWQATKRLTVDGGIRFEHLTPWGDAHGQGIPVFSDARYQANSNPSLPGFSWHALDSSVPNQGLSTRWAYVEPRVGLAWDVYGAGNTVLRAGAGIYRAHDSFNDASSGSSTVIGLRQPSVGPILLSSISSQAGLATAPTGLTYDNSPNAFLEGDDKQPQVYTWNAAVDQKLGKSVVMEIAYVGNHSNDLLNNGSNGNTSLDNLNSLPIGALYGPQPANQIQNAARGQLGNGPGSVYPIYTAPGSTALTVGTINQATVDAFKKYQVYNHVNVAQHNLYANYDALQASLIKQAGKAHFGINYSWSHALGVLGAFDVGNPSDPFNVRNNYTSESYDRHHIFNASYSYSLGDVVHNRLIGVAANGWEVSGITTLQSGPPLTATSSTNFGLGGTINVANGTNPTTGAPATANITISNTNLLGTPDVTLQPLLLCSAVKGTGSHRYVSPSCFGVPTTPGVNGAYRLPFLGGPVFFDSDLTAAKTFRISEHNSVKLNVAAFNFLNHPLNSFTGVYPNQTTLTYNGPTEATIGAAAAAATSQNAEFGTAPDKEGRRILELGLHYDF
jgi:hypothetical protein